MALQVNLILSKTYFLPGELVQVCVQIFNDAESTSQEAQQGVSIPQVIHIKELSFQACGTERTDSSFIHRLHRPEVPADVTDSRKRVRSIFSTESAVLVSDHVLAPHAVQNFQLRFRLPSALPPTFRGSAVRFFYLIQVKAVYEVHRGSAGDLEAVVYETTASTSLTVWPGTSAGGALPGGSTSTIGGADRRTSSMEVTSGGNGAFGAAAAASSALQRELLRNSNTGGTSDASSAGVGADGPHRRMSGAGGAPSSSSTVANTPSHAASYMSPAGNGYGGVGSGGDDGDIVLCDYVLGRNCRIRWQVIPSGDAGTGGVGGFGGRDGNARTADGAGNRSAGGTGGIMPLRGVIPFGVNRPFESPFTLSPTLALMTDTDSETDDVKDSQDGAVGGSGAPGALAAASSSAAAASAQASHVQRQVSSGAGAGGLGGLGPFGRQPSRRGSLFGKVYALNVGDQPLLRLLLQAPLEVPLQPGATFGGVLDFRQPMAPASTASGSLTAPVAGQAGGVVRPAMACYDVAVLLETEEVISPECRPQHYKRDGSGVASGAPYVIRRLHAEHHELCSDTALTSFTFSLPATATPSFRTPMVALRWVLRFELTVGPRISFAAMDKRTRSLRPPLEQLVWSLPLTLRPPVAVPR